MLKISWFVLAAALTGAVVFVGMNDVRAAENGPPKPAVAAPLPKEDQAALELGRRIHAIQRAIANPKAPDALQAVKDLGTDQRYYVMVRGWLSYQLSGDQSILDANRDRTATAVKDRIAFLHQAIRALDLE